MKSLHLKRMVSGALAAVAVAAVFGVSPPAIADPAPVPDNASDAFKAYQKLSGKAEKLNEDHLRAQDDLRASERSLAKASGDLNKAKRSRTQARADEARFRQVVDKFTGASYIGGASFSGMSAALSGGSAQDFLERSSALDMLATQKNAALSKLRDAVDRASAAKKAASDAQNRAEKSRDAAAKLKSDIEIRQAALNKQIERVKAAYNELTAGERDFGAGDQPVGPIVAPGKAAQVAVDAAMTQRGDPYVYGAEGPDEFDCSGLTSWSYNQAGISLPRSSSAQAGYGTPVSRDQLAPGDLVFFYQPVSHVGIYIGNGQMVHAPQSGDVVKVAGVQWGDYSGARRVA